jgi:tRNA threonylcarbamoyl adenosine modification protein (Sua5/YciO/YrdC/YwlC family)
LEQAQGLATAWPEAAAVWAERFWPGALTLVVPADPGLARRLGSKEPTVGLRCPDHPVVAELCRAAGALAVTSANRHGEPPLTEAAAVRAAFAAEAVAVVVDGGTCDGAPSTVVDCTAVPPRCLRAGALEWTALTQALVEGGGSEGAPHGESTLG